ncbi:MAG: hypothetical protein NTW91_11095 [Verrucomicrobia bacterium]|nr:hypothetical protein [Verrucomicrobiota bacterium]
MDDGSSLRRHRAAGQRRACPAQADWNTLPMQKCNNTGKLSGIRRGHHKIGHKAFVAQPIRVISSQLRR